MSLGAILGVKWANEGKTYCGTYCNAQGAIQTLGETAVALFTLAITLLSFVSIIRGRAVKYRLSLWGGVSAAIWLFVLLWAVLGYTIHAGGAAEDSFYTPTPYCESFSSRRVVSYAVAFRVLDRQKISSTTVGWGIHMVRIRMSFLRS
jgi:hypothetical protein